MFSAVGEPETGEQALDSGTLLHILDFKSTTSQSLIAIQDAVPQGLRGFDYCPSWGSKR
jgi:hypothetical protein